VEWKLMRIEEFVIGIVFFVVAGAIFIFSMMTNSYNQNSMIILSIIIGIIGFVLICVSFVLKEKPTNIKNVKPVHKRSCPKCVREIPFDAVVCPIASMILSESLEIVD
jgi:DMSO reductase anchor subunit